MAMRSDYQKTTQRARENRSELGSKSDVERLGTSSTAPRRDYRFDTIPSKAQPIVQRAGAEHEDDEHSGASHVLAQRRAATIAQPAIQRAGGGEHEEDEHHPTQQHKAASAGFASTAPMVGGSTVNGITASENHSVKQMTGGAVDLHSMGASVEHVSQTDTRLTSVGARSLASGHTALVSDSRDRGHEIWHMAQQAQGRVSATTSVGGQPVNDDAGLEAEADRMGSKIK